MICKRRPFNVATLTHSKIENRRHLIDWSWHIYPETERNQKYYYRNVFVFISDNAAKVVHDTIVIKVAMLAHSSALTVINLFANQIMCAQRNICLKYNYYIKWEFTLFNRVSSFQLWWSRFIFVYYFLTLTYCRVCFDLR